jgi:hypothetical protein
MAPCGRALGWKIDPQAAPRAPLIDRSRRATPARYGRADDTEATPLVEEGGHTRHETPEQDR